MENFISVHVPLDRLTPAVGKSLSDLMSAMSLNGHAKVNGNGHRAATVTETPVEAVQPSAPAIVKQPKPRPRKTTVAIVGTGWEAFLANLPAQTTALCEYMQQHKTATRDDLKGALELSSPKALGGLLGSLSRWATNAGLKSPIEADGKNYRWVGP